MTKSNDITPRFFATAEDFRGWLGEHHDEAPELWVGSYKKRSSRSSIFLILLSLQHQPVPIMRGTSYTPRRRLTPNVSSSAIRRSCLAALMACTACSGSRATTGDSTGSRGYPASYASRRRYAPKGRDITITTVPVLVKEQRHVLPFLEQDFAKGGVLEGKEVYAFSPSTVTVFEGDTIHFTFINPEDDVHSFVLPDFSVSLPGQKTTTATYVAKRAGIYPFVCAIQTHLPMMWGQLVVLTATAVQ